MGFTTLFFTDYTYPMKVIGRLRPSDGCDPEPVLSIAWTQR